MADQARRTDVAGTKSVAGRLVASLATAVLASGCGAGLDAHTREIVPPVPGVNADSADHLLGVRDLHVRYNGPQGYRPGSTIPLEVRLFNEHENKVSLTCVKVTNGTGAVALVGGAATPSATPTAPPSASPSPASPGPASASATASPNGKKAAGSATPTPAVPPSTPSATSAAPSAAPSTPACGAGFSLALPPFGFAVLSPETGRYLAVSGLDRELRPGDAGLGPSPSPGDAGLGLTFAFDDGTTITVEQVPLGMPLSPLPRIPGDISETA